MILLRILGVALAAVGLSAACSVGQDYAHLSRLELRECCESDGALDTKYDCLGSTVRACLQRTGMSEDDGVVPCANAEAEAWSELLVLEHSETVSAIRSSARSSDPCEPSIDECLRQLDEMHEGQQVEMDQQCALESASESSAGRPELAWALCKLRETARRTIRMRSLRDEIQP